MSSVTLAALQEADPAAYRAAARAWDDLAARLDAAYEQYVTGQQRVGQGGRGAAIRAAIGRVIDTGHELSNACLPARQVARALHGYADEVTTLQRRLETALASASAYGISVDLNTGSVTAPPSPSMDPTAWRNVVDEIHAELAQLLSQARRLDATTSKLLRAQRPTPDAGFGRDAATPVTRDVVEAQLGQPPAAVFAWWQMLSPEQQEWALQQYPDLLGPLNGIPAADRDTANRINLDRQLREIRQQADTIQYLINNPWADPVYQDPTRQGPDRQMRRHELSEALQALRASEAGLLAVQDKLATTDDAYLLLIDGTGDGRAVIAVGNPDHAAHTAVFVPGVGTDLRDINGDLNRALLLRQSADVVIGRGDDISVVYWLDYNPPNSPLLGGQESPARDGGAALLPFVDGLRATHTTGDQHVTVVGHSYGTTVVAEAAKTGQLRVDDFIAVGSPGLRTDHVSELSLPPGHVWVGLASDDPIRLAPDFVHGPDPANPAYGANRFLTDTSGHSGYWEPDSQSLLNQAHIIVGQYDNVVLVH